MFGRPTRDSGLKISPHTILRQTDKLVGYVINLLDNNLSIKKHKNKKYTTYYIKDHSR